MKLASIARIAIANSPPVAIKTPRMSSAPIAAVTNGSVRVLALRALYSPSRSICTRPKRVDICRPRSHLTPASAQLTQSWLAHRCLQYPFVAGTSERVHVGSLDFRGGVRSESDETELKPFFGFDETTFRPSI